MTLYCSSLHQCLTFAGHDSRGEGRAGAVRGAPSVVGAVPRDGAAVPAVRPEGRRQLPLPGVRDAHVRRGVLRVRRPPPQGVRAPQGAQTGPVLVLSI